MTQQTTTTTTEADGTASDAVRTVTPDIVTLTAKDLLICEPFTASINITFMCVMNEEIITKAYGAFCYSDIITVDRTAYVRACLNRYRDALAPWATSMVTVHICTSSESFACSSIIAINKRMKQNVFCCNALYKAMRNNVWTLTNGTWVEQVEEGKC